MSNNRLWLVFFVMFLLSAIFCWRLFCLQIIDQENWKSRAEGQQKIFDPLQGERGDIYLSNKDEEPVLVATNQEIYHAYISPREIKDEEKESFAKEISSILDIDEDFILEKLKNDNSFEVIKKDLTTEQQEKVKEREKIYIQEEIVRFYPEESLASHLTGFVGGEKTGQYGVEQYYENTLKGTFGLREGVRSPFGYFLTENSVEEGSDLFLTVDYNVQYFVEKKLKQAVEDLNAKQGTVIVGDPDTGKIIALASYPTFNPNDYNEYDVGSFKNLAIQETFEPGSVFKPLVMAVAIEEGVVTPDEEFYDSGERKIYGRTVYNYAKRSYGLVDMTEVIKKSINTGMVYVIEKLDKEVYVEYLRNLGFFQLTGVDLHGEIFHNNKNFFQGYDINYATSSYGQGVEITVIQLFSAFCTLANGGKMVHPYIVENVDRLELSERRIFSSETSLLVTKMMVETVDDGFGKAAKVPGYNIAGKTGTAQVAWSKIGEGKIGYSDETVQGFAGFAPAFDPRFVIIVRIDNPATKSAEVSAAPVFREIADYLFKYNHIQPDYQEK
jgi:cell division protein FtsI (penicillin-binding protein 3)